MSENDADPAAGLVDHSHSNGSVQRLGWASAANVAFAVIQVVVGLAIGSVVVLADLCLIVARRVGRAMQTHETTLKINDPCRFLTRC